MSRLLDLRIEEEREMLIEQGRAEGRAEVRKEREKETSKEIARNLLALEGDFPIDTIAKACNLTVEEVNQLKEQISG